MRMSCLLVSGRQLLRLEVVGHALAPECGYV